MKSFKQLIFESLQCPNCNKSVNEKEQCWINSNPSAGVQNRKAWVCKDCFNNIQQQLRKDTGDENAFSDDINIIGKYLKK